MYETLHGYQQQTSACTPTLRLGSLVALSSPYHNLINKPGAQIKKKKELGVRAGATAGQPVPVIWMQVDRVLTEL